MNEKVWLCDRKIGGLLVSGTIMMAGETIVALANSVIAGQMLGETALSAVHLNLPIYTLAGFIAVLIGIGASVCFSQEMGSFNKRGAHEYFSQGVIMSVVTGAITFLILMFFRNPYVNSVADTPELRSYVIAYYDVIIYMALGYPLMKTLCFVIFSDGGELYGTLAYIPLIFGSIIISILCCRERGISGIAFGTVVSQLIALLVLLTYFFSKKCTLKFIWYVNLRKFAKTLKYSVADAGSLLCGSIFLAVVSYFFVTKFGSHMLPAWTAVVSMMEVTLIFDGLGCAIQPIIGTYRGAGNTKSIRHLMGTSAKIAVAEGLIATLIVELIPGTIAGILGIKDPAVLAEAVVALRTYGAVLTVVSILYLATSYYLFMDKLGLVAAGIALKDCIMPLICIFALGSSIGMNGVWIGYALSSILTLIALLLIARVTYGCKDWPLFLDTDGKEDQLLLNIRVKNETISWASQSVMDFAMEHGVMKSVANKAGVMLEEILVLSIDEVNETKSPELSVSKNETKSSELSVSKEKAVYAEIFADATGDELRIIVNDTGDPRMQREEEEMPLNARQNGLSAYVLHTVGMRTLKSMEMANMGLNSINLVFKKS